jgi:hypothetical protein
LASRLAEQIVNVLSRRFSVKKCLDDFPRLFL